MANRVIAKKLYPNKACLPIFGHTFFRSYLKVFMGTQETIIYRCCDAFFWPLLARKWARPPHALLMVWSLQTRSKSWPPGENFWANRYLEIMASKPPPLKGAGVPDLAEVKIEFYVVSIIEGDPSYQVFFSGSKNIEPSQSYCILKSRKYRY